MFFFVWTDCGYLLPTTITWLVHYVRKTQVERFSRECELSIWKSDKNSTPHEFLFFQLIYFKNSTFMYLVLRVSKVQSRLHQCFGGLALKYFGKCCIWDLAGNTLGLARVARNSKIPHFSQSRQLAPFGFHSNKAFPLSHDQPFISTPLTQEIGHGPL